MLRYINSQREAKKNHFRVVQCFEKKKRANKLKIKLEISLLVFYQRYCITQNVSIDDSL